MGLDVAAVPLDDLPADCQANASSLEFTTAVQALEDTEYLLSIFVLKADSVVPDAQFDQTPCATPGRLLSRTWNGAHPGVGRMSGLMKLHRVAYQVLEQLAHLHRIRLYDR